MTKEQEKYNIVSRLLNGDAPKDVSEALDVPYSKVLRLNRELKDAQEANTLNEFIAMDEAVMAELMEGIAARAPDALQGEVVAAVANVSEAKSTMEVLSHDLQVTAKVITTRIKVAASTVEHVSELDVLADALCKLQNAFFNKNSTQVNVQNNYGSDGAPKYGAFLSDKPSDN